MKRERSLFAATATTFLCLVAFVGGCGEGVAVRQEEAYWKPHPLLMRPPFAQGSEVIDGVSCGLADCVELAPWLSPAFLACEGDPELQYPREQFACYFGEYRRQRAALLGAEQKLYARLPEAEARRLRDAQRALAEAEKLMAREATADYRGSVYRVLHIRAQTDYAVRRRIDLELRLELPPAPPGDAPQGGPTLEEVAEAIPEPKD